MANKILAARILCCGSRSWSDNLLIRDVLSSEDPDIVIHGGAQGADTLVALECKKLLIPCAVVEPYWQLGRAAGPRRNEAMLFLDPYKIIAFWDGNSPGTANMIGLARQNEMRLTIYLVDGGLVVEG